MHWNKARREITRALDTALMNWREERLNDLLSAAWEEYTGALKKGTVLEIEPRYKQLARAVVRDLDKVEDPREVARS